MKGNVIVLLLLYVCIAPGCKPSAYFSTPNDLLRQQATVYLVDGTEKTGAITIQFESGVEAGNYILLANGGTDEKITLDNLKCYKIKDDLYFPKLVDVDLNGTERLLFVKRLAGEDAKMQLFELYQDRIKTSDGFSLYLYFIAMPSANRFEAWNTAGRKFLPRFDDRVSLLVDDCDVLAKKIRNKDNGYSLSGLTLSNLKKVEVYRRITNEYNACH